MGELFPRAFLGNRSGQSAFFIPWTLTLFQISDDEGEEGEEGAGTPTATATATAASSDQTVDPNAFTLGDWRPPPPGSIAAQFREVSLPFGLLPRRGGSMSLFPAGPVQSQ